MRTALSVFLFMMLPLCLLTSCASPRFEKNIEDYRGEIEQLERRLEAEPENFELLKELGSLNFETRQYRPARDHLQQAYALNAADAQVAFYLGMTLEVLGEKREALAIHSRFAEFGPLSKYRRWMQGRFHALNRELVAEEIRGLVQQENELGDDRMAEETLAVFPFSYQGANPRFQPLGRGLSQMIINDLGQVPALTLLERMRLQVLLDELDLAQSGLVAEETAPRAGKILGAGRVLSGSFNVDQREVLSVDVMSWDMRARISQASVSESDALNNLFRLEKEIVFKIIDELNIELTPEEREKIDRVPTQNLEAFLAYSRGLEELDRGDPRLASGFFQQAVRLDPNFGEAQSSADTADSVAEAGGGASDALDTISAAESGAGAPAENLVDSRVQNIQQNVGSSFFPGQDNRQTATEVENAGVVLSGDLGEPPPPPPPGN